MYYISKIVLNQSGKFFASNYEKALAVQNMYYISCSKMVLNQCGIFFFASNHKKSTSYAEHSTVIHKENLTEKMSINLIF